MPRFHYPRTPASGEGRKKRKNGRVNEMKGYEPPTFSSKFTPMHPTARIKYKYIETTVFTNYTDDRPNDPRFLDFSRAAKKLTIDGCRILALE